VVKVMSGGRALGVSALSNEIAAIQYPPARSQRDDPGRHSEFDVSGSSALSTAAAKLTGRGRITVHENMRRREAARTSMSSPRFRLFVLSLRPDDAYTSCRFRVRQGGTSDDGFSLRRVHALVAGRAVGDIGGAFSDRSCSRGVVAILTVVLSVTAGPCFRRRFPGSGVVFYLAIASLPHARSFRRLAVAVGFQLLGLDIDWYTSALAPNSLGRCPMGPYLSPSWGVQPSYERPRPISAQALAAIGEVVLPSCARHHRRRALRVNPRLRKCPERAAGRHQEKKPCR